MTISAGPFWLRSHNPYKQHLYFYDRLLYLEKINGFQKQRVPRAAACPNNVVFIEGVSAFHITCLGIEKIVTALRHSTVVECDATLSVKKAVVIICTASFAVKCYAVCSHIAHVSCHSQRTPIAVPRPH